MAKFTRYAKSPAPPSVKNICRRVARGVLASIIVSVCCLLLISVITLFTDNNYIENHIQYYGSRHFNQHFYWQCLCYVPYTVERSNCRHGSGTVVRAVVYRDELCFASRSYDDINLNYEMLSRAWSRSHGGVSRRKLVVI